MPKAKTLRDQIDRLRGIRGQLTAPEEFWAAHKDEYREILAQVTLRELTPLRPQDMEPEEWEYHVNLLAAGIQAALLNETETGLRFWL
jgi:trehalose-6-phosphate synthase